MKVSIYNSTHGPHAAFVCPLMKSIQVGCDANHYDYGMELGDNFGPNISSRNPYYCELTAMYWAWKNDRSSTHLGFMHYRRHLNFSQDRYPEDTWGCITYPQIDTGYEKQFGIEQGNIEALLEQYDLILPKAWDVRNAGSASNYEHYQKSNHLNIEDYDLAMELLAERYPEYVPYAERFNRSNLGYYTNIFVMKRAHFEAYAEWLFGFLSELELRISTSGYSTEEKRVIGHIAERLFNIYIYKLIEDNDLSFTELQRTFVLDVPKKTVIRGEAVDCYPFVICFDNNYAHSGGALIRSIIKHSSPEKNYQINVFCDGVSVINRVNLLSLCADVDNVSIRLVDTSSLFISSEMNTSEHFTAATYARLFIPTVFPDYKKIVFIDADMIVCDDVAKLYDIDLDGKKVGAVKDLVMEGFVKFNHPAPDSFKGHTSYTYLKDSLGMRDPDNYFQAGLLIMDIERIKSDMDCREMINLIYQRKYWYHDQDILNKIFEDQVKYIDLSWNVYHGNGNTDDFFPNLNLGSYCDFIEARKNMKIVHYAGDQKPWINPRVDYAQLYFDAVAETPWGLVYANPAMSGISGRLIQVEMDDVEALRKHVHYFYAEAGLNENRNKDEEFELLKQHVMLFFNEHSELNEKKLQQMLTAIFERVDNKKPIDQRQLLVLGRIKHEVFLSLKKLVLIFAPVGSKRFRFVHKVYRTARGNG
ncbi:DUF4422 domain-containing protein [Marinobacter hydrocarbonoclasticus]|nr:DUF4422 domain-containing protein [Marinobacter nauticus]